MTRLRLILLPGFDGTGRLFGPLLREIPDSVDTTVVDYPANEPLGYRDLVERLLPAIRGGGDFCLVAESFGGPLAVMLAAERPEGLTAIVLAASFARWPPLAAFAAPLLPLAGRMALPRWLIRSALFGGRHDDLARTVQKSLGEIDGHVLARRLREVRMTDIRPLLAGIGVPCLILRAARDRLVPRRRGEELHKGIAGSRLVTLDGPHGILQTRPHEAWAEIARFIGRTDETDPKPLE